MLTIRHDQLQLLAAERIAEFERDLANHIAQHFPDLAPRSDALARDARRKAAAYGLTSARDIYRFANLCAVEGIDFDRRPTNAWMRALLTDRSISNPSERLRVLTSALLRRAAVAEHNARVPRPSVAALPEWLR